MARGALATVKQEEPEPDAAGEPRASKRRCVQSACVPCRKRKSKCDGGTPVCATCTAVYKTPCFYDAESESRRTKTASASSTSLSTSTGTSTSTSTVAPPAAFQPAASVPSTADNTDNAAFLVASIRSLPEHELHELIQHIRKDAPLDMAALADSWRKTVTLPPSTPIEPHSLETDLSMLLGKPAMTPAGESRYFGHTSGMSLVLEDENYTRPRVRASSDEPRSSTWTPVTQDIAFVERLLELYFRWSHPFYIVFSRECFYKDFRSGREKYCSPLLVNAILAYACHYTDEPAGRTDPHNIRTAGDHFFEEARRLLYQDECPSLTTTQALCVMAMREPSAGRDSSGFMYMGQCMRMAIELGLHLKGSAAPAMRLTPSEIEVRKVTFWGCFTVDTVWSICVGRISQLPRAAITLDKPILDEPTAGLRPEVHAGALKLPLGTVTTSMFLQEFSTLSELINDNNYMFFAPKERFTSRRLLGCYNNYKEWYKNLPQALRLDGVGDPQPHIIVLHMLYHTAVVHLFRPMIKLDLIHSDVCPRDACLDAANQVSGLLRLYRRHYSMRACQLVLTHVLLSVCTVYLLYSKDSQLSHRNLVEGMRGLEDMSVCHYFGARGFKIVHSLSKLWNLPFPEELRDSELLQKEGSSGMVSPTTQALLHQPTASIRSRLGGGVAYDPPLPPATNSMRRESLSMFARLDRQSVQLASHPATQQGSGMLSASHATMIPSYATSSVSTPHSVSASAPTPNTAGSAETMFWTPVPGMGVPILPRNYQLSPMDLDNMITNAGQWDRFSRDGFKMSDTWQQDPVNAYSGANGEAFSQGAGEPNGYTSSVDPGHYSQGISHGAAGFDPGWWNGDGSNGV